MVINMDVKSIKDPSFLKELSIDELNELAHDIRQFLLESVSKTGGHLSSNLGIVEITIALHYVFNTPQDKLLFDVGHQTYVHKILTGRAKKMSTLRQFGGIAGFQKRKESKYDCFEAGHSSTALSSALGMAVARDLNNEDYNVIPIVGDGAMMSGMSLEALNNIGFTKKKVIIIFNDNNMSINKNVGALTKTFAKMRNNESYINLKLSVKDYLKTLNSGEDIINAIKNVKTRIKKKVINSGIFKEFDIDYLGPIDGHNISDLIRAFNVAKTKDGPVVIHCVTKKGKGYKYTEEDNDGLWHGVSQFDIETGEFLKKNKEGYKSYSEIVANTIEDLMKDNKNIVTITPAMITGSKLNNVFKKYPERCFDCGIAEDYAISFAAGLAISGKHPFISIYSSFLQRGYDQLNQDLARMNLPVVIGIDRAGLVGEDGETHHGVFDISFIRSLPNVVLSQGKDSNETMDLLYSGFKTKAPYFVRYPRDSVKYTNNRKYKLIKTGTWEFLNKVKTNKCSIISYGDDVNKINNYVKENKLDYDVINARFIKPIDEKLLDKICKNNKPIYVYTNDILKGGLGDDILEYINFKGYTNKIYIMGINDIFVSHGDVNKLKKALNNDLDSLFKMINKKIKY